MGPHTIYSDTLDWGPPAWSNAISTGPSYKTIKLMQEYQQHLFSFSDPLTTPVTFTCTATGLSFDWGKPFKIEEVPFYTPTPRQPPVPVMPERLT